MVAERCIPYSHYPIFENGFAVKTDSQNGFAVKTDSQHGLDVKTDSQNGLGKWKTQKAGTTEMESGNGNGRGLALETKPKTLKTFA